jgi:hypothetical protein
MSARSKASRALRIRPYEWLSRALNAVCGPKPTAHWTESGPCLVRSWSAARARNLRAETDRQPDDTRSASGRILVIRERAVITGTS